MKKETNDIVITEKIKHLIEEWEHFNKMTEQFFGDSASDGAHEWAVQNLQNTEKALKELGISYSQIPLIQKKIKKEIKKEKIKKAANNIKSAMFGWLSRKNNQNG